jgi:hypothetical protein
MLMPFVRQNALLVSARESCRSRQISPPTRLPRKDWDGVPLEMLKMKIDPAMCMKTHERQTKWPLIEPVFLQIMDTLRQNRGDRSGFRGENADYAIILHRSSQSASASRSGVSVPTVTRPSWPCPARAGCPSYAGRKQGYNYESLLVTPTLQGRRQPENEESIPPERHGLKISPAAHSPKSLIGGFG